ncbi:MAG TPA: type II toxin-antitoxin system VapC family toxin [Candidatus Kapabacteria bacterium]|jgi:predicted nucleic acid-binding protein|nr:type II toxin-antitoxin system VapC family toxin [Candidatus Kapabacteria bacterium]
MNVVDSSAWLEYIGGSPLASVFAPAIEDGEHLVVPSIAIYEVNKKLLVERRLKVAEDAMKLMQEGKVISLDPSLAMEASQQAISNKLPLADSVIYATAMLFGATIWTTDKHFKGLPNVEYREKV